MDSHGDTDGDGDSIYYQVSKSPTNSSACKRPNSHSYKTFRAATETEVLSRVVRCGGAGARGRRV